MEAKEIYEELALTANALKAVSTLFSDAFTSGSDKENIRSVSAQPTAFAFSMYVITDYIDKIFKLAQKLDSSEFIKDYPNE